MADEQTTDGSESFVVHESDGKETAAAEGSVGETPEADAEPKGVDDDTDTAGEPDGDGEDAGEADDDADGDADAEEGDSDEDDVEGDDDADDDGGDDSGHSKNKVPARTRIRQLTRARHEADERADAAEAKQVATEARLAALEKKLTPDSDDDKDKDTGESKAAEDGKPDPDKFTYGELDAGYQEALMEWRLDQRDAKREAKHEKTRQSEAAQQQADKVQKSYDEKIVAGVEAYDDFEKVVVTGAGDEAKGIAPKYDLSPDFALMALESDVGHHVVYEVASDPEFSRKLAKMSPQMQAQQFGRLAAKYSSNDATPKKKKKATSALPPPTSKVNGSGVHKKAAKDMDFAEFEQHANKEVLGIGN